MREERDLKGHLSSPDLGGKQQAPETRDLLPFIFMESTHLPPFSYITQPRHTYGLFGLHAVVRYPHMLYVKSHTRTVE